MVTEKMCTSIHNARTFERTDCVYRSPTDDVSGRFDMARAIRPGGDDTPQACAGGSALGGGGPVKGRIDSRAERRQQDASCARRGRTSRRSAGRRSRRGRRARDSRHTTSSTPHRPNSRSRWPLPPSPAPSSYPPGSSCRHAAAVLRWISGGRPLSFYVAGRRRRRRRIAARNLMSKEMDRRVLLAAVRLPRVHSLIVVPTSKQRQRPLDGPSTIVHDVVICLRFRGI